MTDSRKNTKTDKKMCKILKIFFCIIIASSMLGKMYIPIYSQENDSLSLEELKEKIVKIDILQNDSLDKKVEVDIFFDADTSITESSLIVIGESIIKVEEAKIEYGIDNIVYHYTYEYDSGLYTIDSLVVKYNNVEYKIDLTSECLSFCVEEALTNQTLEFEEVTTSEEDILEQYNNISEGDYSGKCGDNVEYCLTDGELIISGTGDMYSFSIGNSPWYDHNSEIKQIFICDGVTSISEKAFYGCSKVENIYISSTVNSIYCGAFEYCEKLKSIFIPLSVINIYTEYLEFTKVTKSPFSGCSNYLTIYTESESQLEGWQSNWNCNTQKNNLSIVYGLKREEYNYWTNLDKSQAEIIIPDYITRIISGAFNNDLSIEKIIIPESVKVIESFAFQYCDNLKEIIINNGLLEIGDYAFSKCSNLQNILLPDTLQIIGISAFQDCSTLESIILPANLYEIGFCAFLQCYSLKEVVCFGNIKSIPGYCFGSCTSLTKCEFRGTVTIVEKKAFNCCSKIECLLFPFGLKEIQSNAFIGCYNLKSVYIPSSVVTINGSDNKTGPFYNYNDTTSDLTIYTDAASQPDGWEQYWNYSSHWNTVIYNYSVEEANYWINLNRNAKEIVLPDYITTVFSGYFKENNSLEEITLSKGVKSIGKEAFKGCKSLKRIYFEGDKPNFGYHCFSEVSAILFYSEMNESWKFLDKTNKNQNFGIDCNLVWIGEKEHDFQLVKVITSPSCITDGYSFVKCSNCFKQYEIVNDSLGHDIILYEEKEATCSEDGIVEHWHCTRCLKDYEDENATIEIETTTIEKLGHNYTDTIKETTCTESGYTIHTCTRCKDSYTSDEVEALGHDYVGIVTKKPKCEEAGTKTNTCSRCFDQYTEAVDPTGHTYQESAIEPTCTEIGYTLHQCKDCEVYYMNNKVIPTGHDYIEEVVDPTCLEFGYTVHICKNCNDEYKDNYVPPLGHKSVTDEAKEATCTESGLSQGRHCERCEKVLIAQEEIKALEHTLEKTSEKEATCLEKGEKTYTCSKCDETYTEDIDALGHNYTNTVTEPTCTEKGYTTHQCKNCKDSYTDSEVDALSHDYDEGTIEKEASFEEDGLKVYTCKNDASHTIEETLPKYGENKLEGYSLSLSGTIGVNFYMTLSDSVIQNTEAYVTINYKDTTTNVLVANAAKVDDYYVFTMNVSAKEMKTPISMQLHLSNGLSGQEYTYTIEEYANYILEHYENTSNEYNIAKSMLTYGLYSQQYFNYNTDSLPQNINELETPDLSNYAYTIQDENESVDFVGARLVLTSNPGLKLYFIGNGTFKVDGNTVETTTEGKYTVVTISNIESFYQAYTITCEGFELSYSLASYGNIAMNGMNATLKNLIKAMAAYYSLF